MLAPSYDHGPVKGMEWDSFEQVRGRVADMWAKLPPAADAISAEMRQLIHKHNPHNRQ